MKKLINYEDKCNWGATVLLFVPFVLAWLLSGWLFVPALIFCGFGVYDILTKGEKARQRRFIKALNAAWVNDPSLSPLVAAWEAKPTFANWMRIEDWMEGLA